jgi:hypothetical protein
MENKVNSDFPVPLHTPHVPFYLIWLLFLVGVVLIVILANRTLPPDTSDWMATAKQLYLTGKTGFGGRAQHLL